ncbi:MAG TPA: transcription antitermination factor NusB [Candidatus Dojkabacteria bacterium]|nr:transcription antitermination factor NusB [Candidatus Dojkabacteria bacterium]HRO65500.1 transcription antitermination factor NusB [Candidatus Dojkabacteria bacterium]HRP36757.1 transcription antitermination factor NusB [Candidatus Dojkabacteria bacterium]HRP51618.1 transcription antitermination factor NusB [Candidatus Dojkabacteria bacterium]
MQDSRHNARILALQQIFELYFHKQNLDQNDNNTELFPINKILEEDEIKDYDKALFRELIEGMPVNEIQIDEIIEVLAPEWPIDKIATMDLQILRIAILEGFILNITPEKVAIDEAIELTKEFSNDQSRKFISGVLGNLIENKSKYIK